MKGIVKPSTIDCHRCLDIAESFNAFPDCKECHYEQEVEIITFTDSFWGSHATVVNKDGEIKSIPTELLKVDLGDIASND